MSGLAYRPDFDAVRERLSAWWEGGDLGRPALQITVPRAEPHEQLPEHPEPPGWITHYSTSDFDYRVHLARRACVGNDYLAEAVPSFSPCLGPNCLALYLGCTGEEMPGTVWFHRCIDTPEAARFQLHEDNRYWDFNLRLIDAIRPHADGRFLIAFPDLIEGLDTLAAMRGTEALLIDLLERPDWVHDSLVAITQRYFEAYDVIYQRIRDDRGSHFWAWAPGRMAKLQCDFSAMISPEMFRDFMVPVLKDMTARLDHCMYHWDGPGAVAHLDALLSVDDLDMIQWTPGAGAEPVADPRWWPLYHRIVDAGKKVILLGIGGGDEGLANLARLRAEFGPGLKHFMLGLRCDSHAQAEMAIAKAEV